MTILMVLTSHDRLGATDKKAGFGLEEFATPYYVSLDADAAITVASPKGRQPPLDPQSDTAEGETESTRRLKTDPAANEILAQTILLSPVGQTDFDGVFYPGGQGPLWNLADDAGSIALIEGFAIAGKPVATVCHAPAVLHRVMIHGQPLVRGKRVTGFSNAEEAAVGLTKIVPFLLKDELKRLGGLYEKVNDWQSLVVVDGNLITGQNPASSKAAAQALPTLLS